MGIAIMHVFRVRFVVAAATIASVVTGGCLATAASAAPRGPAAAVAAGSTGYSVTGRLAAVAAISATSAWAVGSTGASASTPLILHWNGSQWSSVATGAPAGTALRAVAASSASNAWAVGDVYGGSGKSVILHWNGAAWKQVSFPAPTGTYLSSVSVTSTTNAWAVGYNGSAPYTSLALHWNGSAWKSASLPKFPLQAHEGTILNSVSATSPSNAWAAGAFNSQYAGPGTGFTLHWNGQAWTRVASAPAGLGDPVQIATTGTYAWLIGCPCQGGPAGTVTGFWNGKAWKTVYPPAGKPDSGGGGFAVAAKGTLAWAAAEYCHCSSGNYTYLLMLLRWTGSGWKTTPIPSSKDSISGLAVTSSTSAWAVGSVPSGSTEKTVILHWNGSAWH